VDYGGGVKLTKKDVEWAQLIKNRDNWTCQKCGKSYPPKSRGLHAAHIFSRRFKATRTDPENGLAFCFGCHMYFHSRPLEFIEFATKFLGEERYEALKAKAKKLKVN
jgi:hypothetical protein